MPSLFMVMLGGRHAGANTEVHDVVFAIGESLEETYPQLKSTWFGEQKGLHIDAWMQVNHVQSAGESYQIQFTPSRTRSTGDKLWLINLGGYDVKEFGELHRYVLVVAEDAEIAKQRGKEHFAQHWQKQHTDRVIDVDDCIAIEQVNGQYIQLEQGDFEVNHWENTYLVI